ncbi:hypothetical protein [Alkalibacillus haloalkaliphilus]|uniref:Uncharacterized protein n=1 Tax=Alkalibacillus haloalkaliphilus TaxID=94136 RepID=A0A511W3F8_9BACI|nr:hypothetical protein [Alkalibacillus haloalkaliphilus]GEN45590.1 hypothetical protein AHA02nite_13660 [Alkalibacillus haloalkaliphilus]
MLKKIAAAIVLVIIYGWIMWIESFPKNLQELIDKENVTHEQFYRIEEGSGLSVGIEEDYVEVFIYEKRFTGWHIADQDEMAYPESDDFTKEIFLKLDENEYVVSGIVTDQEVDKIRAGELAPNISNLNNGYQVYYFTQVPEDLEVKGLSRQGDVLYLR